LGTAQRVAASGVSERIEEIDQIPLLLFRETNVEALIVEVHHIHQSGRRSIVEIGRAGSQSAEPGPEIKARAGSVTV
jgi:hypothetical protein